MKLLEHLTDDDIGSDVYDYLGIEVSMKNEKVVLKKSGLINKILETTGFKNLKGNVKPPCQGTTSCFGSQWKAL